MCSFHYGSDFSGYTEVLYHPKTVLNLLSFHEDKFLCEYCSANQCHRIEHFLPSTDERNVNFMVIIFADGSYSTDAAAVMDLPTVPMHSPGLGSKQKAVKGKPKVLAS